MATQCTHVYEQRESDEVTDEKGKEATTSTQPLPKESSDSNEREGVEFLRGHPIIRNGFDVSKFLISDRDDGDPAFTFRCFVLGTVFTALAGVITMLYVFKPVEISISVIFIQILVFLCGEAWARFTPQPERLPWLWLQAVARFLNFGQPFRIKEHVLASLIASSGNNGLSGVEIYAVERLFYNRNVGASTAVLATFSISLIGFLLAGVLRPIVVYPAELVYWGQLPQVALFQSLHHDREINRKRLIKFGWALLLSGVWQLFPAYVFTWLGGVSIFCVASSSAAPEIRKVFGTLFGGASSNEGVGILNFGLDWQYITSSYLSFPLKQQLNSWIGIGLFYAIMPALYYGNAFGSKALGLPFMSNALYNDTGGRYPVTTMLSLRTGEPLIDEAKLNELGNPRLTSSAVWGFFTQNLAIGGLIAHVLVFWRKDLIRAWRQAKDRTQPDPHYQAIITRYKEVPSLWYWILFVLCFVAGLIVNIKGETSLPWWGYIVALLLGAFIAPFSCFLYGLYGNGIGTNQLSKMIGGAIHPHRPLANLYFASWSHQVILLCVNLAGWLKLGQYTKIPPRVMFFTQIYASLLGAAINYAVMIVVVTNKREILIDPAGNNIWSGAYLQSLNTQAITWSIASKVYGVSGRYFIVPLGLVIGLTFPVLHWAFTKCFPRTAKWEINTAIIAEYAGMNYYGNTSFISSCIAVGVFSQIYLRKRLPEIFAKYNYLIGAGLDGGSQIVIFVLSFAVYGASGKARPFPSWWGAPAQGNPDHCVLVTLNAGEVSMLPIGLSTSFLIAAIIGYATAIQLPGGYDTVWTTQSENSAGSMPLGGGDLGMNVWAESGSIYFYLAQSGAFDENNSLLKLGRVKIGFEPNPFSANASIFEQRLRINDGYITVSGDYETSLKLWVDMASSNVHVELDSNTELNMTASFESWRTTGYNLTSPSQQQTSWGLNSVPDFIPVPKQRADTIGFHQGQGVLSYHHNANTPLFDFQAQQQDLPNADTFFDPMRDNTFGAYMFSPQLQEGGTTTGKYLDTDFTSFNLVPKDASTSFRLYIVTNQQQTADVETWKSDLLGRASTVVSEDHSTTVSWWHDFWDRSYILINPDASSEDTGFQVGKNYQYFRYMMGCNARGNYPLRFNGGVFTFDPVLTDGSLRFTPDYRKWSGGTFTAQNQRLLYWPLLKTGDWDIIQQEFNFYGNISPNHRKLGQRYFGIDAALTSEQMDNTGLPNVYEYNANEYSGGQQRSDLYPEGIMFNDYLSWLQDTANEFADMVLHYSSVYGKDVSEWMSFVEYQLAWFDDFYQQRNGLNASTGKLIIYPGSGAETYKLALDASSTVSGLSRVITDLLQSGLSYVKGNQTYYQNYLARVPSTPLQPCPGNEDLTCIAPASNYSYTQNDEPTALYPVFPWSEYGLGQPTNLSYAYNSYFKDQQSAAYHGDNGWRQDQIWFARMGLTDLAKQNTVSRLSDSTQYRFSAFKGPNYDWSPDINHYGSAAIGLQEMILQTFAKNNSQIRLLPAFPSDWTGSFKLTAPQKTIIQGDLTGTDIQNLVISPSSRMGDVVWGTNESQVVA